MTDATVTTNPAPTPPTSVQTDIARIETAIDDLAAAGEALFADEITALKQKRDALLKKARTEAAAVTTDLTIAEQTFSQKHGGTFMHTIEIALLAAIFGKLFGVI